MAHQACNVGADALKQQHVAVDQHEGTAIGVRCEMVRQEEVAPEADLLERRRVARQVHVGLAEAFVCRSGVGLRQDDQLLLRHGRGFAAQAQGRVLAVFHNDEGEGVVHGRASGLVRVRAAPR
ncbi:hypothetical protein D3C72_1779380 [compost metagenome]